MNGIHVHIKDTITINVDPSWIIPWKTSPLGSRCTDCHNWGGTRPWGKFYVRGPPSRFDPKCLMFIDHWCLMMKRRRPVPQKLLSVEECYETPFMKKSNKISSTWIKKLVIIACKNSKLKICVIYLEPPSTRVHQSYMWNRGVTHAWIVFNTTGRAKEDAWLVGLSNVSWHSTTSKILYNNI